MIMVRTLGLPSVSSCAVAGAPDIQVSAPTFTGFDSCIVLVAVLLIIARATCVLVTKSESM